MRGRESRLARAAAQEKLKSRHRYRAAWSSNEDAPHEFLWRANVAFACLRNQSTKWAMLKSRRYWKHSAITKSYPTRSQIRGMLEVLRLDWATFSAPLPKFCRVMSARDVRPKPVEWNPRLEDFYRRFQ